MESEANRSSRTYKPRPDGLNWMEIGSVVLSATGVAISPVWLYQPGRDFSSISGYFDPGHESLITLSLLLLGLALSYLPSLFGESEGSEWALWSRVLAWCGMGLAMVMTVLVPIVIWVVKLIVWIMTVIGLALVTAVLYNLKRLERGQRLYWPRSPEAMARWLFKAAARVPFGG